MGWEESGILKALAWLLGGSGAVSKGYRYGVWHEMHLEREAKGRSHSGLSMCHGKEVGLFLSAMRGQGRIHSRGDNDQSKQKTSEAANAVQVESDGSLKRVVAAEVERSGWLGVYFVSRDRGLADGFSVWWGEPRLWLVQGKG